MNELKNISIRARYAIGLTCAKLLLRDKGLLYDEFYRKFLTKIGLFTSYNNLATWEEENRYYCYLENPDTTAEQIIVELKELQQRNEKDKERDAWSKENYTPITLYDDEFYHRLVDIYQDDEHKDVTKTIDLVSDLGSAEMYAAMSKNNSQATLVIIEEILKQTGYQDEFNFEKIAREYPFRTQSNRPSIKGWGKTFTFGEFKRK